MKPMLIVFEGADAVGKNTMSTRFHTWLGQRDDQVSLPIKFSFPDYNTTTGKAILRHLKREISVTEKFLPSAPILAPAPEDALMFQALMISNHLEKAKLIRSYLNDGFSVVCDRYWYSGYAYGTADGLSDQWLLDVCDVFLKPDLNILLDLPPEIAAQRREKPRDRYEEDREKQKWVRHRYLDLWLSADNLLAWPIIKASESQDEVFSKITDSFEALLKSK